MLDSIKSYRQRQQHDVMASTVLRCLSKSFHKKKSASVIFTRSEGELACSYISPTRVVHRVYHKSTNVSVSENGRVLLLTRFIRIMCITNDLVHCCSFQKHYVVSFAAGDAWQTRVPERKQFSCMNVTERKRADGSHTRTHYPFAKRKRVKSGVTQNGTIGFRETYDFEIFSYIYYLFVFPSNYNV